MAVYTYYAFTLLTGDIITEVPLQGAAPSWQVNDPADLGSPTIYLGDLMNIQRSDIRAATVPYKTGIAVDRDGTIIWSGIVTARRYDSGTKKFTLTVPGLLAYWKRRIVASNNVFTQTEQFDIVGWLMQQGWDPTIPVDMDVDPSGVLRDRTIAFADAKFALDEILEIADNENGFELAIDTYWDPLPGVQSVLHRLRMASPRLGTIDDGTGSVLTLEYPGNVRNYTWDEDGEQLATTVLGQSTDENGLTTALIGGNQLLDYGFPQVWIARQWSNITTTDTFSDHVSRAATEAAGYLDAPVFVVPDSGDTAAGSWVAGDDVRLRITDDARFPRAEGYMGPGLDQTVRLSQATLDPIAQTIQMTMFGFTEAVQ